jgi:sugar lactone lactonase YvrE
VFRLAGAVLVIALVFGFANSAVGEVGDIHVVVGSGKSGYSGDGGPAMFAELNVPSMVFLDGKGQLYVVDTSNHRVRLIAPNGTIRTVAGNGQRTYSQDGGHALKTAFMTPSSITVDRAGYMYISEWTGHRIRRVDPDGRVWTVAGNGQSGYVGEGLNAVETSLWTPAHIFLDGNGNLYLSEWHANRIRRIAPDGTITTVAGNGNPGQAGDGGPATKASINSPNGIFVNDDGTLYIADLGNNRVRRVDPDGIITTVAGEGTPGWSGDGGPATDAKLNRPSGVFVDAAGDLYIADTRNKRIRRVNKLGFIETVAGGGHTAPHDGGKATESLFRSPSDVFVDQKGDLYVTDGSLRMVRRVEGIAAPTTLAAQRPDARLFYDPKPIELYDAFRVLTHYGTESGTGGFDPRLDLEPDGRISLADLPRVLRVALGF